MTTEDHLNRIEDSIVQLRNEMGERVDRLSERMDKLADSKGNGISISWKVGLFWLLLTVTGGGISGEALRKVLELFK